MSLQLLIGWYVCSVPANRSLAKVRPRLHAFLLDQWLARFHACFLDSVLPCFLAWFLACFLACLRAWSVSNQSFVCWLKTHSNALRVSQHSWRPPRPHTLDELVYKQTHAVDTGMDTVYVPAPVDRPTDHAEGRTRAQQHGMGHEMCECQRVPRNRKERVGS